MYRKSGKTLLARRHQTNEPNIPKAPFTTNVLEGTTVYSIVKNNDVHVLYLHGGAYVHYGDNLHFRFLTKLAKQANVSVHYIDYPLAPATTFEATTSNTIAVIQQLQEQYPGTHYIMGDSSGGGLALAIANQLPNIAGYWLMSPWVDVSLTNPELHQEDYTDGFYTIKELQDCGTKYAPGQETNPLASPLYHSVLPEDKIIAFAGTHDVLSPDILRLEQRFPAITIHYYQNAPHVFPLLPFTKEQQTFIKTFLQQKK